MVMTYPSPLAQSALAMTWVVPAKSVPISRAVFGRSLRTK